MKCSVPKNGETTPNNPNQVRLLLAPNLWINIVSPPSQEAIFTSIWLRPLEEKYQICPVVLNSF